MHCTEIFRRSYIGSRLGGEGDGCPPPPPPPPPPGTLDFLFNSMELGKQVWNEVKVIKEAKPFSGKINPQNT